MDVTGKEACKADGCLRLGTRSSDLAMKQTLHVKELIEHCFPGIRVQILSTDGELGDMVQNESLKSMAAKSPGLFTKKLEVGLIDGLYDAVVHSLKDVPTTLPDGLEIAAISFREDPRDALVVNEKYHGKGGLSSLPAGSIVGTSSVRREAMLKRAYPQLQVKVIRGNVNTRLKQLDEGKYDAIVLAIAGLNRLGAQFSKRAECILDAPEFYYGVGQGALGIECRTGDTETIRLIRQACNHKNTAAMCKAERALLRTLQGGCQVPLGVQSKLDSNELCLECMVLTEDGSEHIQERFVGDASDPEKVGEKLAILMLNGHKSHILKGFGVFNSLEAPRPGVYGSAESPNIAARKT